MLVLSLIALQAAATPAPPAAKPDIEINAKVRARSVEVRQQGPARVVLHAEPDGGAEIIAERSHPPGQQTYRNLRIDFRAETRIAPADGRALSAEAEPQITTGEPE